jgi:hypothetical protein
MDNEELEDIDSLNDVEEEVVEQEEEETVDTLKSRNQSLYEQLQKAKGKIRGEDGKWIKKPEPEVTEDKPKAEKSEGFDYGQKAFLVANGIKGEKEMELVQKVMSETGRTIEQVLGSKYFQADLTEMRELATTADATIEGKRAGNGAVNSVEYWASKPFEEVPKDMQREVVNYKLKKETGSGGNFYNS